MIYTRVLTKQDVNVLVEIHVEAFSGFFLTSLGKSFLKVYYNSFEKSKDGVAICAFNELSEMVGFCVGTAQSKGFHKRLLMNSLFQFGFQFFILLFKNPKALFRLYLNMEKVPVNYLEGKVAELLSIGVRKNAAGKGVGATLLKHFENELLIKNANAITLTTDLINNEKAISFYQKNGYEIFVEFVTFPNRKMYRMIKYLKL